MMVYRRMTPHWSSLSNCSHSLTETPDIFAVGSRTVTCTTVQSSCASSSCLDPGTQSLPLLLDPPRRLQMLVKPREPNIPFPEPVQKAFAIWMQTRVKKALFDFVWSILAGIDGSWTNQMLRYTVQKKRETQNLTTDNNAKDVQWRWNLDTANWANSSGNDDERMGTYKKQRNDKQQQQQRRRQRRRWVSIYLRDFWYLHY